MCVLQKFSAISLVPGVCHLAATVPYSWYSELHRRLFPSHLNLIPVRSSRATRPSQVGQVLVDVPLARCVPIPRMREGIIPPSMLDGRNVAMLLVLNESNLVVGKRSVPASGVRELFMDLESGSWALSASSFKSTLSSNYRLAVQRVGHVSSPDVELHDEDLAYFMQQRRHAAEMSLLLPLFGQDMEDECLDLECYQAYLTGVLVARAAFCFSAAACPHSCLIWAAELSDHLRQGKSRCSSALSPNATSPRRRMSRI